MTVNGRQNYSRQTPEVRITMIDVVSKKNSGLPAARRVAAPLVVKHYVLYPFFFRRSHSSFSLLTRGS
jgi:hypothetical protein